MNRDDLYQMTKSNIAESMRAVCETGNLPDYLKVVYTFPTHNYLNHLLIWKQRPNAGCIAGMNAIRENGIKIPEKSRRIALLYPDLTKDSKDYTVVFGYDISEAEGYKEKDKGVSSLFNRIKTASGGYSIVEAEEGAISGQNKGYAVADEKRFVIKRGLNGDMYNRALIEVYVGNELTGLADGFMKEFLVPLVTYCVYGYFGLIKAEDKALNVLAVSLGKHTDEEIRDLLDELSRFSGEIILDLSGNVLSFNETAILNAVFRTDDRAMMHEIFESAAKQVTDEGLRRDMEMLDAKIMHTTKEYLAKLKDTVRAGKLNTYPEYPIEYIIK